MHGITHDQSQGLIDHAYSFAKEWHGDQKRKYTGEPYINHPVEVAQIVAAVTEDCETICAAFLHDVIEDTAATYQDLVDAGFGWTVAGMVVELSDVSKPGDGNRAVRKSIDRIHLSHATDRSKTVKLADLISNSSSIMEHDPKFAKVYMAEKEMLLDVLVGADESLMLIAKGIVNEWKGKK